MRSGVFRTHKLDPDKTACLNGDREQLVELLRDHYDFAIRRAEAEVDDFYAVFEKKIEQATEESPGRNQASSDLSKRQSAA